MVQQAFFGTRCIKFQVAQVKTLCSKKSVAISEEAEFISANSDRPLDHKK